MAKEADQLNDFQVQLVQLAATLNGDHKKDTYPHKLVENITVVEAVKYIESAFEIFCGECQKAKENGANDRDQVAQENAATTLTTPKSFPQKLLSCIICDH